MNSILKGVKLMKDYKITRIPRENKINSEY